MNMKRNKKQQYRVTRYELNDKNELDKKSSYILVLLDLIIKIYSLMLKFTV